MIEWRTLFLAILHIGTGLVSSVPGATRDEVVSQFYEFHSVREPRKIGVAIYEKHGSRFVYRVFGDRGSTPSVVIGFDGNEHWIAMFADSAKHSSEERTPHATCVARYGSWESLSNEFPKHVQNRFRGHSQGKTLVLRIAVIEDLARLLRLHDGSELTGATLRASTINAENVVLVKSNSDSFVPVAKSQLDPQREYIGVSSSKLDISHVWDYLVEIDKRDGDSIVRILADKSSKFLGGTGFGGLPTAPLPLSFEMRRGRSRRVSMAVFVPQYYSDSDTELVTFPRQETRTTPERTGEPEGRAGDEREGQR